MSETILPPSEWPFGYCPSPDEWHNAFLGIGNVLGPVSSIVGDVVAFNSTDGKHVVDTGISAASLAQGPATATAGNIAAFADGTGKLLEDSGVPFNDLVAGPTVAVQGDVVIFGDASGKFITDTGITAASLARGPGVSVDSNIPIFNGTSGSLFEDSGIPISAVTGTVSLPPIANAAALAAATSGALFQTQCFMQCNTNANDGGSGIFIVGPNATADGGTIINDASGRSWYRQFAGGMVSARWFGCQGDGATDDTANIQKVLNYIGAKTLGVAYFPAGNYIISSALVISPSGLSGGSNVGGTSLIGDGLGITRFTYTGTTASFFTCTAASGVSPFNLIFQGFSLNATNAAYNAWHVQSQNINRFIIQDVEMWSTNPTGTALAGIKMVGQIGTPFTFYTYINRSHFVGCSIFLDGIDDGWVTDNAIQPIIGAGTGGRNYGLQMTNAGNIKVRGNHIYPALNGGILVSNGGSLCVQITNNFFDTNPALNTATAINIPNGMAASIISGNGFSGVPGYALNLVDCSFNTITNNAFYDCGGGITSAGKHTINMSKSSTGCVGNQITGNIFRQDQSLSPAVYAIFESTGGVAQSIYGANTLSGGGYNPAGIFFGSTSGDCLITPWAGMLSKNGGVVTMPASATTATFAHGLAFTPSAEDFSFTPLGGSPFAWGSATKLHCQNVTATTADLVVDVAPGSNAISFGWRVEYRGNFGQA